MKRWQRVSLSLVLILSFTLASLAVAGTAVYFRDGISHGVKLGSLDLGGLTEAAAVAAIEEDARRRLAHQTIRFVYGDQQWESTTDELSIHADAAALAHEAYMIGRTGPIWLQLQEWYMATQKGRQLAYHLAYEPIKAKELLDRIVRDVERPSRKAHINYQQGQVQIVPEIIGQHLERAELETTWQAAMADFQSLQISLPVKEDVPEIRAEDLKGIDRLLGSYSSYFNAYDSNRSKNVYLASRSIDDTLVRAGSVFSFNSQVGKRTQENGYKEAPVFINGKLVPDWGGGVCQVSSTLYNAVLLADLEIVERTSHYSPPGYVPLGQDATVADDQLDFQFTNTSQHNLYISSTIEGNRLTVQVFGSADDPVEVRIVPLDKQVIPAPVVVKPDASLEAGRQIVEERGESGYRIKIEKIRLRQGVEISREIISSDDFPPSERIIRVGAKTAAEKKNN